MSGSPAVCVGQFRPGKCGGSPRARSARAMRGSELWNRNEIRVSEPILVPVLDSGRVGPTEHRSRAGVENSPTSPTGFSAVPWTPVGINPRRVDRLGCSGPRIAPLAVEPLDSTKPRSTRGSAARNLPNPPTGTAGERHMCRYGRAHVSGPRVVRTTWGGT